MYHYELSDKDGQMRVVCGGGAEMRPVDDMILDIVRTMEKDVEFLSASEWKQHKV